MNTPVNRLMNTRRGRRALVLLAAFVVSAAGAAAAAGEAGEASAAGADPVEALTSLTLDAAAEAIGGRALDPEDDQAIFALGLTQFLQSGERLARAAYTYGASVDGNPLLRMLGLPGAPIPRAITPTELSYEQLREIIGAWRNDLARAEATLARVGEREVSLALPVGLINMDYSDDGARDPDETLWAIFNRLGTRFRATEEGAREFVIAFDRGDVEWLRGYCHVCMAVAELILAHDFRELFERCAHLAFARPKTPHAFLLARTPDDFEPFLDMIAAVHLVRFEVVEPEGVERARQHLLSATGRSRAMWRWYDAETDNDREWIPNPGQSAAIPRAEVSEQMREMWLLFLDEAEEVLEGERLVRFWRPTDTRGVNLKRVFSEPRGFDLVLWVQGTAAAPYLEHGQTTSPRLWDRMETAFGNRVFRHGFWFN